MQYSFGEEKKKISIISPPHVTYKCQPTIIFIYYKVINKMNYALQKISYNNLGFMCL